MRFKMFMLVLFMSVIIPQDSTNVVCDGICLPEADMIELAKKIEKLESDISIYKQIMIQDSITISQQDSLIFVLNQKYDLCEKRLEEVEPGFFDNKYLWFLFGILGNHGISNIK